jgi:hypothetical protein
MAVEGWFQRRKHARNVAHLRELLATGEVEASIAFYDEHIALHAGDTDRELRAAVHLHRWLRSGDEADVKALELLAGDAAPDSAMVRSATVLRQHQATRALARALRDRTPDRIPQQVHPPISPDAHTMESLARAALLAMQGLNTAVEDQARLAQQVKRLLMPTDGLEGPAQTVASWLELWAAWTAKDDVTILRCLQRVEHLGAEHRNKATLVAIHRWGRECCRTGRARDTHAMLAQAARTGGALTTRAMVLCWVIEALGKAPPGPLAELLNHAGALLGDRLATEQHPDPSIPLAGLLFCKALVWFSANDNAQGRDALQEMFQALKSAQTKGEELEDLAAVAWTLDAFSRLSASRGWSHDEHGSEERKRELRVQNQALWGTLRDHVLGTAVRLQRFPARNAWRGDLLVGLVSFAETSRLLDDRTLVAFEKAATRFGGADDAGPLEQVRAALLNRALAASRAMALVDQQDWEALEDLYHSVLLRLGGAIPPLVRISVVMSLWDIGKLDDPLPELLRAGEEPDMAARAQACIESVQARRTLVALREVLVRRQADSDSPSLGPLEPHETLAQLGALARSVVQLRQGRAKEALSGCPEAHAVSDDLLLATLQVRLRAAWQAGDTKGFQAVVDHPTFRAKAGRDAQDAVLALQGKMLLEALADGKDAAVDSFLERATPATRRQAGGTLGAVVHLLEQGRGEHAARLLRRLQAAPDRPAGRTISPVLPLLEGMVAASRGQFGEAGRFMEIFAKTPATATVLGDGRAHTQLAGWARFLAAAAQIAQIAASTDDLKPRWPSVQRELTARAQELSGTPALTAYGHLIQGLVVCLSSDIMVDQATVDQLNAARRVLALGKHAPFLEEITGRLIWRGRIVTQFWSELGEGNYKECRSIFQRELHPAFGHRMPPTVQLGMLLVEWDEASTPTPALLLRLDSLQQEAPSLDRALCEKVRSYLQDGDRVKELTRRVATKDFPGVVDFVRKTHWAGMEQGAMPVPAAIALLYALHKTEKTEEALELGGKIKRSQNLPRWVQDYAGLMLGYLRFRQEDFDGAVEAFEGISSSDLVGHDVDRYWAAGHFSRGLELLKVKQQGKAFDAFARAVSKRGASARNVELAPLFIHFGLKNMETRSGSRSLQAFALLEQSLEGAGDEPATVRNRLLAGLGRLLCRAVMAEPDEQVKGEEIMALVTELQQKGRALDKPSELERTLRLMAICQQLRTTTRSLDASGSSARQRAKKLQQLRSFLDKQLDAIDKLAPEAKSKDPLPILLRGLILLHLQRPPDEAQAMDLLIQALQMGLRSPSLIKLVEKHKEAMAKASQRAREARGMYDAVLLEGWTSHEVRAALIHNAEVRALYALNKDFALDDLGEPRTSSGFELWSKRLEDLEAYAKDEAEKDKDSKASSGLIRTARQLETKRTGLVRDAERLAEIEKELLLALAGRIRLQLEPAKSPKKPTRSKS